MNIKTKIFPCLIIYLIIGILMGKISGASKSFYSLGAFLTSILILSIIIILLDYDERLEDETTRRDNQITEENK